MTSDAQEGPPRLTHQKILEEDHARINHIIDVLHACCRIMDLARAGIEREDFLEGIYGEPLYMSFYLRHKQHCNTGGNK